MNISEKLQVIDAERVDGKIARVCRNDHLRTFKCIVSDLGAAANCC